MSLVQFKFESEYLNGNTEVSVILPDKPRDIDAKDYYKEEIRYKVLWLLHGGYGDDSDWQRKSMIELYAREKNLIVVMPSALNSFYSEWPKAMMGMDMFHCITEELMPMVYAWYPASDKREDNFIAGLSMGGFGTAKYAANYPEKFAAAAVLSAAPIDIRNIPKSLDMPLFKNLVENAGGIDSFLASPDNTWDLLKKNKDKLPKMYFACGTDDFLYEDTYLPFKKYAEENGIPITFEEIDGYGHEWRFWDLIIQRVLIFFGLGDAELGKLF